MSALFWLKGHFLRCLATIISTSSPKVQREDRRSSTLEEMPAEILLHIASFLPASSVASMSLTSKRHHKTLLDSSVLELRDNCRERVRFLRLLEVDLPKMMVCCSCNILYRWKKSDRYLCPNRFNHAKVDRGALWCFAHHPAFIYRNMVDAFLRGFERGPLYGPQLEELSHNCKSDSSLAFYKSEHIDNSLDARVVMGKLLLHSVHQLSVPLGDAAPVTLTSGVDIDQAIMDRLVPAINGLRTIGCAHSNDTLPAVILEAFKFRVGCSVGSTRSLDLLNCGYCATDSRVRVELGHGGSCVEIEIEKWQSFGGRDPEDRNDTEDAQFYHYSRRNEPFNINHPPTRNLEQVFNGGFEGASSALWSPDQPRTRQSWIQSWSWGYDSRTPQLQVLGRLQ